MSVEGSWSDICGLFARTVKLANVSAIQIVAFGSLCCGFAVEVGLSLLYFGKSSKRSEKRSPVK